MNALDTIAKFDLRVAALHEEPETVVAEMANVSIEDKAPSKLAIKRPGRITISLTISWLNITTWVLLLLTAGIDLLYVFQIPHIENHFMRLVHMTTSVFVVFSFVVIVSKRNDVDRTIISHLNSEEAARSGLYPLRVAHGAISMDNPEAASDDMQAFLQESRENIKGGKLTAKQQAFLKRLANRSEDDSQVVLESDRQRVDRAWTNHNLRSTPGFDGRPRNLKI